METIYIPLGDDEEIAVTLVHRGWNGIDSDPRIIERAATLVESLVALSLGAKSIENGISRTSRLGFAQEPENRPRPGLAGGASGPGAVSAAMARVTGFAAAALAWQKSEGGR